MNSDSPNTPRRSRWPRFSLRSAFILLSVVCVLFGMYGRKAWQARRQHATVLELQESGAHIDHTTRPHELPPWKVRLLGHDFLAGVEGVLISGANGNTVEGVDRLIELSSHLRPLERIRVENVLLNNDSLLPLKRRPDLEWLSLCKTNATDQHVKMLRHFGNLEVLDLKGTDVTDDSVDVLSSLEKLVYLRLQDTEVTEQARQRLQTSLPNCKLK